MSRVTILLTAVFLVAAAARAQDALSWLPEEEGTAEPGIRCSVCSFPCAKGTVNCWACGSHLPGAKTAGELAPVKFVKISFGKAEGASAGEVAAVSPDIKFLQIESWIGQNPDKFDDALSRLNDLLQEVRGTALEVTVTTRIGQLRRAKIEASRPKTPQEREAEASTAVIEVMRQVRGSKNVQKNIERLEALIKIVEGTSYEDYVRNKLERQLEGQR